MVIFPNCKINIGLNVLGKRADGYHNLQSVFYPIAFYDALEIIESNEELKMPLQFTSSGITIGGASTNNLCIKAFDLVKKDFPLLPALSMHIHKTIPIGAGLGGGSSDAVFTIQLINKKFHLELTPAQCHAYALELGSDCPFFLLNKPAFASGRGEILEDISLDLSDFNILLVNPGIMINTGQAFSQLKLINDAPDLKSLVKQPIENWKENISNDFEKPVFEQFPEIAEIKQQLYNLGAIYASMSGTGSSVYGIFNKGKNIKIDFPEHYFNKWV